MVAWVIGKKPQVAPYSGAMLAMVAWSSMVRSARPVAEELDELADHALLAQHLGDGEHQVGGGGAFRQGAGQLEADDLGDQHRDRLAQHGRLRLDAADAPAQHRQAVDHGGVAVGADHGVGIGDGRRRRPRSVQTVWARYSRLTWWQMPVPGGTTRKLLKADEPQRRKR